MNRFNGTAARQLDLLDDQETTLPFSPRPAHSPRLAMPIRPMMRMLRKDIYAELSRRRRRAQIAARHLMDAPE